MEKVVDSNMEIEKEFSKFINLHKRAIIEVALDCFEEEGIYDIYPFNEFENEIEHDDNRAFNLSSKLLWDSFKTPTKNALFESAYTYCWERLKDGLVDDYNATEHLIGKGYIKFENE